MSGIRTSTTDHVADAILQENPMSGVYEGKTSGVFRKDWKMKRICNKSGSSVRIGAERCLSFSVNIDLPCHWMDI
jgi:hypothetical protein